MLGDKLRSPSMLAKGSTNEPHPLPFSFSAEVKLVASHASPYSSHPGVGEIRNASLAKLSWKAAKCHMKVKTRHTK